MKSPFSSLFFLKIQALSFQRDTGDMASPKSGYSKVISGYFTPNF